MLNIGTALGRLGAGGGGGPILLEEAASIGSSAGGFVRLFLSFDIRTAPAPPSGWGGPPPLKMRLLATFGGM